MCLILHIELYLLPHIKQHLLKLTFRKWLRLNFTVYDVFYNHSQLYSVFNSVSIIYFEHADNY